MTAYYFFMPMIDKRKWLFVSIQNPFRSIKKLKGVFKSLKMYFRSTFKEWDYYPAFWCSKPAYIHIMSYDVLWKDKYNTPRFENPPCIWVHIYRLNLICFWSAPIKSEIFYDDEYWEQALWYLYYSESIENAKKTWPWTYNGKSTWNDKYLL